MDESRFNLISDQMLSRIEEALAACDANFDYELKPGGVIEIEFDNGSRIIVNRHTAAREIWVAARSGGFHFKPEGDDWVDTRNGTQLVSLLEHCISEQAGEAVKLKF